MAPFLITYPRPGQPDSPRNELALPGPEPAARERARGVSVFYGTATLYGTAGEVLASYADGVERSGASASTS